MLTVTFNNFFFSKKYVFKVERRQPLIKYGSKASFSIIIIFYAAAQLFSSFMKYWITNNFLRYSRRAYLFCHINLIVFPLPEKVEKIYVIWISIHNRSSASFSWGIKNFLLSSEIFRQITQRNKNLCFVQNLCEIYFDFSFYWGSIVWVWLENFKSQIFNIFFNKIFC